jgi:conjugal transfer pilus assembly protein TraW
MRLLLLLIITLSNTKIIAKDFGKYGMSFEIKEEGFVEMIQRKLASVDIEEEQNKMTKLAEERVKSPRAVQGIKRATEDREFFYDPTYMLLEDAVLPCGRILHKAGTTINPLDHMDLERRMVFIDGRDKEQVDWLRRELAKWHKEEQAEQIEFDRTKLEINTKPALQNRIILVGGRIFDLQEALAEQLYFDQSGELTSKFGIKATPAIAVQEGKSLKINEILIDEGE